VLKVFLGTAAIWRSREHITIDFIPQALAGTRIGRAPEILLYLLALGFLLVFTWQGWLLTLQAQGNTSPMMIGYTASRLLRAIRPRPRDQQAR